MYTRSGRRPRRPNVATLRVAVLPCKPFLFCLRRAPFESSTETFSTALEGLLVDVNIIEVTVASHKYRAKEQEYIICVPIFLVGI